MAKRIRIGRFVVSIVIFLAILTAGFFGIRALALRFLSPKVATAVILDIPATATILPCEAGVISWDGASLIRFNEKGEQLWSLLIDMPRARAAVSDTLIALYTNDEIRLYDSTGKMLQNKTGMTGISLLRIGGKLIATLSEQDPPSIRVMDRDMTYVYSYVEENREVLDFGLTPDDLLWINTMDVSGAVPVSLVSLHHPSKQAHTADCARSDTADPIYRVVSTKGELWVVGVQNLYRYQISDLLAKPAPTLIYGWQVLDGFAPYDASTLGFIRTEAADDASFQSVWINPSAADSSELYLPATACAAVSDGKTLAILTKTSLQIISIKEGTTTRTTLDTPVDQVIATLPGRGFVYTAGGKVHMLMGITP